MCERRGYRNNDRGEFYEETCPSCGAKKGEYEVTLMGGEFDRNRRTCLRCECTWYSEELTAEKVAEFIKNNDEWA